MPSLFSRRRLPSPPPPPPPPPSPPPMEEAKSILIEGLKFDEILIDALMVNINNSLFIQNITFIDCGITDVLFSQILSSLDNKFYPINLNLTGNLITFEGAYPLIQNLDRCAVDILDINLTDNSLTQESIITLESMVENIYNQRVCGSPPEDELSISDTIQDSNDGFHTPNKEQSYVEYSSTPAGNLDVPSSASKSNRKTTSGMLSTHNITPSAPLPPKPPFKTIDSSPDSSPDAKSINLVDIKLRSESPER